MTAVSRIDPDGVMIAVRDSLHGVPRLPAVGCLEEWRPALIRNLRIGGIDPNLTVVHPAVALVGEEMPGLPAVIRSPHAALVWIRRRCLAASASEAASAAL